jgi:PAS domain S-box-containing protein
MPIAMTGARGWMCTKCALALVLVFAAYFVRMGLVSEGLVITPFLLFYPAVLMTALYCGQWIGVVATGLSVVLVSYFIYSPTGTFAYSDASEVVSLTVFAAMGVFMSVVADRYRRMQKRRRLEDAQRQQAEMMRLSFDAIIVSTFYGGIESWNKGAELLYGYTESEALGKLSHELLKGYTDVPWPEVHKILRTRGRWDGEMYQTAKDGRHLLISARHQFIVGEDGVERILRVNRDITERKLAQDALLRSEKLASVGRMAATIAHEINNPLDAVMNLLYLAKSQVDLPQLSREYIEMADEELNRIAHITRQSLGFYRESNAAELISVNAVVESMLELMKSKIKMKEAVIERQWRQEEMVTAVKGELRQVFSNLLANSLDAIDEHGTIKIRISAEKAPGNGRRRVRVTIADNGKGIPANSRAHLFEPFYTTKGAIGTGLGLWVCKQLIDKHQGRIRVHTSANGPRSGTIFSVALPVECAPLPEEQAA